MPAFFAHGTAISIGGTAIAGLTAITLPDETRDDVETTSHNSTGDRSFLPGLRDSGTVTIEGNLLVDDAGQTALRTNYDADNTTAAFVITLASSAAATAVTYTFTGYVSSLGGDTPFDDKGTFTASIKVTGSVARAIAA